MRNRSDQSVFDASRSIGRCVVREASGSEPTLTVRTREEPRIWVTPAGDLDLLSAPLLDHHLLRAQARCDCVVLDLRALAFTDCAGVRVIVAAQHRAVTNHKRLEVICGSGQVARLLRLTGVDQLLDLVRAPTSHPAPVTRRARRAAA